MKFDFIIGNPPFNISKDNNIAGTGGNTTLYKKSTKYAISLLKKNGFLAFITLKGIITDFYKNDYNNQIHNINLMDNIDVWKYNTCFFILENKPKNSVPIINGGFCKNIFSPNDNFPFTYYSSSNNSMDKYFGGENKVIRKLPLTYDYTNKIIPYGSKFAFNVLENNKNYTVTEDPIFGGTICYIPTDSLEEAYKLKLFVEKNLIYKEYVKRMKLRGHAFGLRYIKKFNINQIHTGFEIPIEWNINNIEQQIKIENIKPNKNNLKNNGELFTPTELTDIIFDELEKIKPDCFSNPSYTFCDPMCGNGQFLISAFNRKIKNGIPINDAISTLYGIDINYNNIEICHNRFNNNNIIKNNIICGDSFKTNFTFSY